LSAGVRSGKETHSRVLSSTESINWLSMNRPREKLLLPLNLHVSVPNETEKRVNSNKVASCGCWWTIDSCGKMDGRRVHAYAPDGKPTKVVRELRRGHNDTAVPVLCV
jgi:hypothetical protein